MNTADFFALNIKDLIGPIMAASVLVSTMRAIKKDWEREWIERVCIGGPI